MKANDNYETVKSNLDSYFCVNTVEEQQYKTIYKLNVLDPSSERISLDAKLPTGYTTNIVYIYKQASEKEVYKYKLPLMENTTINDATNKDLKSFLSKNGFIFSMNGMSIKARDLNMKYSNCPMKFAPFLDIVKFYTISEFNKKKLKNKTLIYEKNKINPSPICYIDKDDIAKIPNGYTNKRCTFYHKDTLKQYLVSSESVEEAKKFIPDDFIHGASPNSIKTRQKNKMKKNKLTNKKTIDSFCEDVNKTKGFSTVNYFIDLENEVFVCSDNKSNNYKIPLTEEILKPFKVSSQKVKEEHILTKLINDYKFLNDRKKLARDILNNWNNISNMSNEEFNSHFKVESKISLKTDFIHDMKESVQRALKNNEPLYKCPLSGELYASNEMWSFRKSFKRRCIVNSE